MKSVRTTTVVPLVLVAVVAAACGGDEDATARDPGSRAPDAVEVEEVTWSDGSLGCAVDGEMYTQAQVEGLRITVTVDGEAFEYHSGGDRPPFLCEDPTG